MSPPRDLAHPNFCKKTCKSDLYFAKNTKKSGKYFLAMWQL